MSVYAPAAVLLVWSLVSACCGTGKILSALGLILFAMAIWVHLKACRGRSRD